MDVDVIMLCKGVWFHKSPQANVVPRLVGYVIDFFFKPIVYLIWKDSMSMHIFH